MPHALLVYPEHPPTYWGMQYALENTRFKAVLPPLGLLTIAAMFPPAYDLRLVDMNVTSLEDSDLEWADLVCTSTMVVQRYSLQSVIERCNRAGVPVVAGGPYPTSYHDEIKGVAHFVLDEAEEIFPEFLQDLENGTAKAVYREPRKPDVSLTPVPRFDLIDTKVYHSMCVQFSRGCPFECEFCDIIKLFGRIPRTKSPEQMVHEFEALYRLGYRGPLFLVDDNFISNKRDALKLLPVLAEWQKARGYPFTLFTEATVNLARMDELMDNMIEAGFNSVFLGIETPNPRALIKMKKAQNTSKQDEDYLLQAVRKIQQKGMRVDGGFILGVDGDDESAFDAQIQFIREAGIPMATIYMLTALKNTDLYERLKRENRLLDGSGEIKELTNMALNFKPEMDPETLTAGYRRVIATLYDPTLENYLKRCLILFEHLKPVPHLWKPRSKNALYLDLMDIRRKLSSRQLSVYGKFIAKVSRDHPRLLQEAIRLAALGYHLEKITRQQIAIHDCKAWLAAELKRFKQAVACSGQDVEAIRDQREKLFTRAKARSTAVPEGFRYEGDGIESALEAFRVAVNEEGEQCTNVVVR